MVGKRAPIITIITIIIIIKKEAVVTDGVTFTSGRTWLWNTLRHLLVASRFSAFFILDFILIHSYRSACLVTLPSAIHVFSPWSLSSTSFNHCGPCVIHHRKFSITTIQLYTSFTVHTETHTSTHTRSQRPFDSLRSLLFIGGLHLLLAVAVGLASVFPYSLHYVV